jgi:sterol desaturase/sphingolipid hydroxylase (fatty acid hydroxylase superfamily)
MAAFRSTQPAADLSLRLSTLRSGFWPLIVVGTALVFSVSFGRGYTEMSLFLVPMLAILLLLLLERVLPERRGADSLRDPQFWNDATHGVFGQGGGNALGQAVFVFAAALLASEISERWGRNLWPSRWSLWIQVPLLVFVADGLDYWRHRWMHTASWFWPVHALHHEVDRLNVLKSSRGHALDMLSRNLLCFAPLAMIGVPRDVMLAYAAAVTVFGPIAHANVAVEVPAFLHRCVLTPQVHRIHHARERVLSCSNYANVFPLWDILFGTFEPGGADNLKIAAHLQIAERTVKSHVTQLYRKLGAENRTQLALRACHLGVRPPPDL